MIRKHVRSMYLFVILTGRMGESYERCYVWSESKDVAYDMFKERYGGNVSAIDIRMLFSSEALPFVTGLSDSGFDDLEL